MRSVVALMGFEAASLAVMSTLHLTSVLGRGSKPFDHVHAGIAEALICAVLSVGAIARLRAHRHGRGIAIGAVVFAIAGFIVGLNFTVRGGDTIDIAYHATVLPLLLLTLAALLRSARVSQL